MSTPLRAKKRGNTIIWILMAMLILGLGGFGARNFGSSNAAIGSVGGREIAMRDYARAVSREMQAASAQLQQPVNFQTAQQLGLDRNVLSRLLASAALEGEAARLGISVGDAAVRDRLLTFPAFQGLDGEFDRDAYKLALQQEGLSEAEFEAKIRDETARTVIQDAAVGATASPAMLDDMITGWATETRDFTLAELLPSDLPTPVAAPDEAQIKTYFDAHPAPYTRPETRQITYVWLSPEMLVDKVTLDEAALQQAYQARIGDYVTPERRLVEKLVYPDEAAAEAAKARFDAGEIDFAGLAAERGLELADVDLGDVAQEDLGAAGEAVFALTAPGVVGPVETDLGPALFAMNGILDAQTVTFEEAREELAAEASLDQARRMIADESNTLEDLLATGATLEDVARETDMELATMAFDKTSEEGIAAYPAFREAAQAATTEDFPQLVPLDDGGVFALRLDSIDPPAVRPLEEVRDQVVADWTRDQTQAELKKMADDIAAASTDPAALESSGLVVTRYDDFARGGFIDKTPPEVVQRAFTMADGTTAAVETQGRVFLIALRAVNAADPTAPEVVQLRGQVATQMSQSIAQDMFQLYTAAVEARAGIKLDQNAIAAVNAQLN